MSIIFVTHDFGVVSDIADRVAVMRHGQLVEIGEREQVMTDAQHPYTRALLEAIPSLVPPPARPMQQREVVMAVHDLRKSYLRAPQWLRRAPIETPAVDGVSFAIRRGEILGLVGESGSGKSTVARCAARLSDVDSGRIVLDARELQTLSRRALRPVRKLIQMVFQDPYGSLNPRRTVGQLIAEGPIVHGASGAQAWESARKLLQLVGMDAAAADRYPHEFSGGQRQRVGIARALALEPRILIADEPVSALDVSVQAQILDLLKEIRDRLNLSMLFITHDLRVAAQLCDTVAVMYRGSIVEAGPTAEIFANPQHAYTRALLAAAPGMRMRTASSRVKAGDSTPAQAAEQT